MKFQVKQSRITCENCITEGCYLREGHSWGQQLRKTHRHAAFHKEFYHCRKLNPITETVSFLLCILEDTERLTGCLSGNIFSTFKSGGRSHWHAWSCQWTCLSFKDPDSHHSVSCLFSAFPPQSIPSLLHYWGKEQPRKFCTHSQYFWVIYIHDSRMRKCFIWLLIYLNIYIQRKMLRLGPFGWYLTENYLVQVVYLSLYLNI